MNNWNNLTTNMILYCRKWEKTVRFYKEGLSLPVIFNTNWFVEFSLNETSRISIADEHKLFIKSSEKKGITISLQVKDIDAVRENIMEKELEPTKIKCHPWNAKVFYLYDPEDNANFFL